MIFMFNALTPMALVKIQKN